MKNKTTQEEEENDDGADAAVVEKTAGNEYIIKFWGMEGRQERRRRLNGGNLCSGMEMGLNLFYSVVVN